ncbi:hypothetical protein QTO34_019862 [Cnephaeus nilssonii]|uniref:Nucleoporin 88 n=1 Tax=Cnephaeus nilssonii TaxID=3371016 RepID=A0AA40HY90_CNENI|nr:hypothetical protein QTO34_019862 [Eptesicus nilssonii]
MLDPHGVLLASDSVTRIYSLRKDQVVAYPLHILYENGETFLTYVSVLHSPGNTRKLLGLLPIHPAAEGNYGDNVCAVLCLPGVPSVLVIATESGSCVAVLCGTGKKKMTKHQKEGDPFDSDSSCPISRHRDPKGPSSYHWTQEADEHSVGLIGFRNFQLHFLDQMKIKICLYEANAVRAVSSDVRTLGPVTICITSTYKCLPKAFIKHSPPSISSPALYSRCCSDSAANPAFLKSSDKECLHLISRATQVFREQYILKQDLAKEEVQLRVKLLCDQKKKQREDCSYCREERKSLWEMAECLADRYEKVKGKQEDMNRVSKVRHSFHSQLPVLSDSERDMKNELQLMPDQF